MLAKIREELGELEERLDDGDEGAIREEIGDILFAVVNLCRFLRVDPETSLKNTNLKFKKRFHYIESRLREEGLEFQHCSLDDLEKFWQESKRWAN